MHNPNEPDARDDSADSPVPEWYARQWFRLCELLDVQSPEEAIPRVRSILDTADSAGKVQEDDGLVPIDDVEAVLDEMNDELDRLKEHNAELHERLEAASGPPESPEVPHDMEAVLNALGADTADEALRHLDEITDSIDQLQADREQLATERNRLQDEVKSLRTRNDNLTDKLSSLKASLPSEPVLNLASTLRETLGTDAEENARTLIQRIGRLYDRLQTLREEREQLLEDADVETLDDVRAMIASMNEQLVALYAERDADAPSEDADEDDETAQMLLNMRRQLEFLYEEKEVLFEHNLDDAQEAVARIESLHERVATLQQQNDEYEATLRSLASDLQTETLSGLRDAIARLRDHVERLAEAAEDSAMDVDVSDAEERPSSPEYVVNTVPPVVDEETLQSLESQSEEDLDALSVGILRLSEAGTVTFVNEAAVPVPGIPGAHDRDALVGRNFVEVAPGTKQHPFFRRFYEGLSDDAMDARFPFVIPSQTGSPTVLAIHLHRKRDYESSWILFRPMS